MGGDEEGFLSGGRFFAVEEEDVLSAAAGGISGFDRIHLVLGNLVWGLMVLSVLLFVR